jgi:hypothetical protein
MNRRKTRQKVAAETPDSVEVDGVRWPVLSSEAMAALCGFTSVYLRELERAGAFKKLGRDRYSPPAVFAGVCEYFRRHDKSSLTDARAALIAARAREIELRNGLREGHLVEMDDVEVMLSEWIRTFRVRLHGLPAAVTRDLALRGKIESEVNSAIEQIRTDLIAWKFTRKKETR